jgi:hypothetical protein
LAGGFATSFGVFTLPITAMMPGLVERPRWAGRRWWTMVGLVFALQLTIIFWLGEHEQLLPRRAIAGPGLKLTEFEAAKLLELNRADAKKLLIGNETETEAARLLELDDPTLFALPHREDFAGLAWLVATNQEFHPFVWSEPSTWLPLPTQELGAAFQRLITSTESNSFWTASLPEVEIGPPAISSADDFPQRSMLRLSGGLANRRLLKPIELPSIPSPEILTNTRVQLAVGADGRPFSPTLLYPGSGSPIADSNALWQATVARFESLSGNDSASLTNPLIGMTWGQMIFEWHTLPMATTNAAGK